MAFDVSEHVEDDVLPHERQQSTPHPVHGTVINGGDQEQAHINETGPVDHGAQAGPELVRGSGRVDNFFQKIRTDPVHYQGADEFGREQTPEPRLAWTDDMPEELGQAIGMLGHGNPVWAWAPDK